jgi:hypothetical protein
MAMFGRVAAGSTAVRKTPLRRGLAAGVVIVATALAVLLPHTAPAWAATVAIRSDGKLLVDGEPFFPFGFFANVGDPLRDLNAVASNGFNTIHCNNDCNDAYYARAAELGIKVIHEIWWKDPRLSVEDSRDKTPLIAYYVADDMNYDGACSARKYTPAQVAARSAQIKSYDLPAPAWHPTTGALALDSKCEVAGYAPSVDILQGFNYPVDNWDHPDTWLERNVATLQMLVAAGSGQRAVIADTQSFAWPGKRLPTPAEVRNMNYGALVLGVSGIMMYTLSDPDGFYLPTASPELWDELKEQAREIRALSPLLLDGRWTPRVAGQDNVYAATWTKDARTLVIVVSTDRVDARRVRLPLPPGSKSDLRPAFARYPSGLAVEEGALSGRVEPGSVQVLLSAE